MTLNTEFLQRSIWEPVIKYQDKYLPDLEITEIRGHRSPLERIFGRRSNSLYEEYKTAGVSLNLEFSIEFTLKGKRGRYNLVLNQTGVIYERLDFTLNQRMVRLFEISESEMTFSPSLFKDRAFREKSVSEIRRKFGNWTVLSCLNSSAVESRTEVFKEYMNPEFVDLLVYFSSVDIYFNNIDRYSFYPKLIWENCTSLELNSKEGIPREIKLYEGKISQDKSEYLRRAEKVQNYVLRKLYPDIDRVYYRELNYGNEIEYELILTKMIGNSLRDISFRDESTGTKKVLAILPYLLDAVNGETVIIDEFDSGFHDLLADELLRDLAEQIKGQLIVTTHDTLFMNTLNSKHIYLLNSDNEGNRELVPLTDYTIQKGYNVQDRYLRGEYDAIPYPGTIDFTTVTEIMNG